MCAVHVVVSAGIIDEHADEIGVAHFLEHMLFKGTQAFGPGEVTAHIESMGGDLEAYTSLEETTLQMTIDAEALGVGLSIVAELLCRATLSHAEIDRERQVILEEMRSYDDDPDTVSEEASAARLFPSHAYGRSVLGTPAQLHGLSQRQLRAYYERCYTPERTTVIIVGDVDPSNAQRLVERALGGWNRPHVPGLAPRLEPPSVGLQIIERPFASQTVQIAFRGPERGHPDTAALATWAAALAEGASGRLIRRLETKEECATSIWSAIEHHRLAGSLTFGFTPRLGRTADSIRFAIDEITRSIAPGLNAGEMLRAREMLVADFLFPSESCDSRAQELADYEAQGRFTGLGYVDANAVQEAHRREIAVLTSDAVQTAVKRWIRPEEAVVVVLDTSLKGAKATAKLNEALRPPPMPIRRPTGPQRHVFPNGATLWVTTEDRPTIDVECALAGGCLAETADTAGLGSAWSRLVGTSAGDLDPDAMGEILDDYAMVLEATSGRSAMSIKSSFPAGWGMEALELFGLIIQKPKFDPKEWEQIREEMLDEHRYQVDRPEQVAEDAAWAALWSGHPWGRPLLGTRKSLSRLDVKQIQRWHRERLNAANVLIGVSGGISLDEATQAIGPAMAALPRGTRDLPARPNPTSTPPPRLFAGRQQVHLWWASRHTLSTPDEFLALKLATTALHAQGGRLFQSLREQRALAYSLWSEAWTGPDGGLFTVALATDPSRVEEARQALHRELQHYIDSPLRLDEIERYKSLMATQTALALQTASARNTDLIHGERFGARWGYEARRRAINSLEPDQIQRALEHALKGPAAEIIVRPIGTEGRVEGTRPNE